MSSLSSGKFVQFWPRGADSKLQLTLNTHSHILPLLLQVEDNFKKFSKFKVKPFLRQVMFNKPNSQSYVKSSSLGPSGG